MNVTILTVPYDSGHREQRMGQGPERFIEHGAIETLQTVGHDVSWEEIEPEPGFPLEVGTSIQIYRRLAERVRAATATGAFPLVLSGTCGSCLGTLAALGPERTGVVWLDAHGDFNTPETTLSGFFDGMTLAAATGRGWSALTRTISGFSPVPDAHVAHIGARDLDEAEKDLLKRSGVALVDADRIRREGIGAAIEPALVALRDRVSSVYLHVDLDVLDAEEVAPANEYATLVRGGLTVEQIVSAIKEVSERFTISAAAITAYDPEFDRQDRVLRAGLEIMRAIAQCIEGKSVAR